MYIIQGCGGADQIWLRLCTLVTNMKWLRLQKFQNIWLRLHNPVYNVIEIICIQYIYFIYTETIIIVLVDMWEKIGDCNDCRGDMEIYSYQVSTRISLRSMYLQIMNKAIFLS